MSIHFTCPHCHRETLVDDKHAGQRGRCVECGQPIQVPRARIEGDIGLPRRAVLSAGPAAVLGLGCGVVVFLVLILWLLGGALWWLF